MGIFDIFRSQPEPTPLPPTPEELFENCKVREVDLDFSDGRILGVGLGYPSVKQTLYCPTVTDNPLIERPTETIKFDKKSYRGDRNAILAAARREFAAHCAAEACAPCLFPGAESAEDVNLMRTERAEGDLRRVAAETQALRARQQLAIREQQLERDRAIVRDTESGNIQDSI